MGDLADGLVLRPMTGADLAVVRRWLHEAHVARWWSEPADEQYAEFERALSGAEPTVLLIAVVGERRIGLVQQYRWSDYPHAGEFGAQPGDIGIDYLIGEPDLVGRGLGTAMIAAVVAELGRCYPGSAVLVSVDATNTASRRVLERNGFALVDERPIQSETEPLSALYRLTPKRRSAPQRR